MAHAIQRRVVAAHLQPSHRRRDRPGPAVRRQGGRRCSESGFGRLPNVVPHRGHGTRTPDVPLQERAGGSLRGARGDHHTPSERTPLGGARLAELFLEAGFPEGVLNVVHGARDAVEALLVHPDVRAISFVGSEPVARRVYQTAAANGKRVQALGGAKNHIVVMPDADPDVAVAAILNSAFGNAGERCLAGSVAVVVGGAAEHVLPALTAAAAGMDGGAGGEPGGAIGPPPPPRPPR